MSISTSAPAKVLRLSVQPNLPNRSVYNVQSIQTLVPPHTKLEVYVDTDCTWPQLVSWNTDDENLSFFFRVFTLRALTMSTCIYRHQTQGTWKLEGVPPGVRTIFVSPAGTLAAKRAMGLGILIQTTGF